jgi:hypothetical protein
MLLLHIYLHVVASFISFLFVISFVFRQDFFFPGGWGADFKFFLFLFFGGQKIKNKIFY